MLFRSEDEGIQLTLASAGMTNYIQAANCSLLSQMSYFNDNTPYKIPQKVKESSQPPVQNVYL